MHFPQRSDNTTETSLRNVRLFEAEDLNVVKFDASRLKHILDIILGAVHIEIGQFECLTLCVPQQKLLNEVDIVKLVITQV